MRLKHFKLSEFDSPDVPGSGSKMKASTLSKLDEARERAALPFRINSGFRTPVHNRAVGGAANSAHLTGNAVDIGFNGTQSQFETIVRALVSVGFTGIGVARTFIHADDSPTLPRPRAWIYNQDQTSLARLQTVEELLQKKTQTCPCCGQALP
jgi:zinc D-Ala-D-Ala carboxypeptidase